MTRGTGPQAADPLTLLPASIVLAIIAAGLFFLDQGMAAAPVLSWISPALALAIGTSALRRASTPPHLHPVARRFWRQMSWVLAFASVGTVVQAASALLNPIDVHRVPLAAAPFFAIPMVYAVWALLRIPTATTTVQQRLLLVRRVQPTAPARLARRHRHARARGHRLPRRHLGGRQHRPDRR
jgi:hypothetical protein